MSTAMAETKPNGTVPAAPAPRQVRVVEDHGPLAYLMDTARFEHMYRIADAMAMASLIPDHLRDKSGDQRRTAANCFLVVNQAMRWGFDPFAVAPETYAVGGKLGFQGKLIAAVVNARAGLRGRLRYEFSGSGDERTVTVSGTFEGESEPQTISLRLKEAKTSNDMWRKDPDQKLVYSGSIKWARRYCPEVVLGVLTDDDLDRIQEVAPLPPQPSGRKSLDDVANELLERQTIDVPAVAGPPPARISDPDPEPTGEPDNADSFADIIATVEGKLRDCKTKTEIRTIHMTYVGHNSPWDDEQQKAITELCDKRADEIGGARGEKANQKGLL